MPQGSALKLNSICNFGACTNFAKLANAQIWAMRNFGACGILAESNVVQLTHRFNICVYMSRMPGRSEKKEEGVKGEEKNEGKENN